MNYSTNFDLTENPISEGGKWISKPDSGNTDVETAGGRAKGTQTGAGGYDDSAAIHRGSWKADQVVRGIISSDGGPYSATNRETELLIRMVSIGGIELYGYEFNVNVDSSDQNYCTIVRWDNFGSFQQLSQVLGAGAHAVAGDEMLFTMRAGKLTAFLNKVEKMRVSDPTYVAGAPGIGFFIDASGGTNNFGLTSFRANDLTATWLLRSSSQYLKRTTSLLDYNTKYSVCLWVYRDSGPGDFMTFWNVGTVAGSIEVDIVGVSSDGETLRAQVWNGGVETSVDGSVLTVGWHKIWIVRESTTILKVYLDGTLDITNTADVAGRSTATVHALGRTEVSGFAGEYWDGKITAVKAWSNNLTTGELGVESAQYLPIRMTNLHGFWPLRGDDDGLDLSLNGRDFTVVNSPYMDEAPDIVWPYATPQPSSIPIYLYPGEA